MKRFVFVVLLKASKSYTNIHSNRDWEQHNRAPKHQLKPLNPMPSTFQNQKNPYYGTVGSWESKREKKNSDP